MDDVNGNNTRSEMSHKMKPWADRIDRLLGYIP